MESDSKEVQEHDGVDNKGYTKKLLDTKFEGVSETKTKQNLKI